MNEPTVTIFELHGRLVCDVAAISDWEGFEKLGAYIEKHHGGHIVEKLDGPDMRVWKIDVGGCVIVVEHDDPYGNSIKSTTLEGDPVVRRIFEDLQKRLTAQGA